jgi:hypothetical protein
MSADVFTSQVLRRALELKDEGMNWSRIAARLGVSDEGLRRRLIPGWASRRQQLIRDARYARSLGKAPNTPKHIPDAEVLAVLRTIPSDTRRPIERLMGDPLPGRSALDKKRATDGVEPRNPQVIPIIHRAFMDRLET